MKLEHPRLRSFEQDFKQLLDIAFSTGARFLKKNNFTAQADFRERPELHKRFICECHRGYNTAQHIVSKQILEIWDSKQDFEVNLVKAREKKMSKR